MGGYIRLDRCLLNWKYNDSPYAVALWVHILLKANWDKGYYRGIEIKRGEYPCTLQSLYIETGISINAIRKWLRIFEEDKQITVKSTNKYTLISVINYAKYQSDSKRIYKQSDTQSDTQSDIQNDKQSDKQNDMPINNKKEEKEEKEEKEKDIYSDRDYSAISKQILDHLNRKTGKAFKYSKASLEPIIARLSEGYTMSECIKVIDIKYNEWNNNSEMRQYLAPDTLFRASKFPRYLNQQVEVERSKGIDFDAINPDEWE